MISRIRNYMEQHRMLEPGDQVAVGVSGGADSLCLLLVLDTLRESMGFSLTAVHVEHGLRGEESRQDAAFVEALCLERGIPCRTFSVDVRKRAREKGESLEEAGRELRYECFTCVCREMGGGKIAVAHHQDDQAETLLLHLFRGAGLKGLCGMAPVRGTIIRPLLEISRQDIEEWLTGQGVVWRTDRTNLDETYTRNKLRLQVLPYAEREICSQASAHVAQAARRLRQVQTYLDVQAEAALKACVRSEEEESFYLELKALGQQEPLMRIMVLQLALERLGGSLRDISEGHLEAILQLGEKETGKELALPGGIRARREYGWLVLEQKPKEEPANASELSGGAEATVPGVLLYGGLEWRFSLEDAKKYQGIPEKTYTKWFDYDRIKQCLIVRTRRPGDYLEINQAHGHRKLKDYLIDCKVPRAERERQLLLTEGSHVLWILGRRISEAYKVTEQTRCLLKVEVIGGDTNDRKNSNHDS